MLEDGEKKFTGRYILAGLLQHVVSVPSRDGDEGDGLGVVTDLLDEGGGFLDDFVETVLAPLYNQQHVSIGPS